MSGISFNAAAGPDNIRLYAIGDVHGCLDLLQIMHQRIRDDLAERPVDDWRIIHLGDYIDRGPQSAEVLAFLVEQMKADTRHIALLGNHDEGMLTFLATGDPIGIFALHGGVETAFSYGVNLDLDDPDATANSLAQLRKVVPAAHIELIRAMPRSVEFGDFFFCHAGIDPERPLDAQLPDDLIWIRGKFHKWPDLLDKVIIHGHTPHNHPEIMANRVNLDTYAWKNGVLSAIVIDGAQKQILQVTGA